MIPWFLLSILGPMWEFIRKKQAKADLGWPLLIHKNPLDDDMSFSEEASLTKPEYHWRVLTLIFSIGRQCCRWILHWLVVWLPFFIFPLILWISNHPNWIQLTISHFSEGWPNLQPPTSPFHLAFQGKNDGDRTEKPEARGDGPAPDEVLSKRAKDFNKARG